MKSMMTKRS